MNKDVSFTSFVKEELVSNDYPSLARKKALLGAFIKINGVLSISTNGIKLILKNESAKTMRFIYSLLNELFASDSHIEYETSKNKKLRYRLIINHAENILKELKVDFLEGKISRELVYNDDTISGYLAGAFLASGSINSPKTKNYHLEITVNNDNYAKWLAKMVMRYRNSDVNPKVIARRDKYVVYLKASASIADFLIMIGAASSCMEFENIRIDRDFVNNANRLTNLDTANMSKTISSASKQIKDIKFLQSKGYFTKINNPKIDAIVKIRLANESISMQELADRVNKELNVNITKSNINHIFRKLNLEVAKFKNK